MSDKRHFGFGAKPDDAPTAVEWLAVSVTVALVVIDVCTATWQGVEFIDRLFP